MEPSPIQINGAVMESEAARVAAFSFSGADTMIIRPGSETFVPGFPSFTDLQSNQMLVSHSNLIGLHKNSLIPIHPAQFSKEIYDMGSTQYSSMPFSAHLNAPGAKTVVLLSVDKRCLTENLLHAPGGNGEAILHSRSSSASDEAKEQQVIEERKKRRMLSNRESARRSRLRKQHHLDELRAQVAHLRAEHGEILNKFNITSQHYAHITEENCSLRSEALALSHQLQGLQHTLNSQSHGLSQTMGIETRNCSLAHISLESGTIAHSWVSPEQWF